MSNIDTTVTRINDHWPRRDSCLAERLWHGLNSPMNANNPTAVQQAQQLVDPPKQPERPGALHGQVWLTVQTNQAQQLIQGREGTEDKPMIVGLIGFADRLRVIWQAARDDDPYADWWLIKIHEAIDAVKDYVGCHQIELAKQLQQMTAIEVSVAASQQPYRVQLQFANPYAYRAAQLLAGYDALVCTALTARHIGLLDGATYTQIQKACARKLRALFMLPQGYRFLKINREAVHKATSRFHDARQLMGQIPEDVLSGHHQAPLAPRRAKLPTGVAGQMRLHSGDLLPSTNPSEEKKDHG